MSREKVRALESFVLGESWVVSPNSSKGGQQTTGSKYSQGQHGSESEIPKNRDKIAGSESMATSSSFMSGPELIMPSIYEAPISEASWVAPDMRSKAQALRKRKKASSPRELKKEKSTTVVSKVHSDASEGDKEEGALWRVSKMILAWGAEKIIRPVINLLLIGAILHILILPELVYQHPSLCGIASVSNLYRTSCAPHRRHLPRAQNNHLPSKYDSITISQRELEFVFNRTLLAAAPINNSLKQSESMLRDVHGELKKTYPGVKNSLDLEFQGCWQAIRAAAQEFDSLKADMQSAVDSLIATGSLQANLDLQQTSRTSSPRHSEVAKATRLSTQMLRREQYLERLSSRMLSKADSLSNNFATLNDHLESIETIVEREERYQQRHPASSDQSIVSNGVRAVFDSLLPVVPEKLLSAVKAATEDTTSVDSQDQSVSEHLRDAASNHRPVMDLIQNLSRQLQSLQKNKDR